MLDENPILKKDKEILKKIGKELKDEIATINSKIENYENEKKRIKFCIHCKTEYNPLTNEKVFFVF